MIQSISLVGKMKTGKTTFALSAPKPLVIFDFEMGVQRVESKFIEEQDKITVITLIREALAVKGKRIAGALDFWKKIQEAFLKALEDETVKTIAFDTFSSVWEIRRMAYLAELKTRDPSRTTLSPFEYFIPNADMKTLLIQSRIHNKILIVTHHTRDIYDAEGKPTGEQEPDGFKATGDLVDIVVWMTKEGGKPKATIKTCGLTLTAEGIVLPEPNFNSLHQIIASLRGL